MFSKETIFVGLCAHSFIFLIFWLCKQCLHEKYIRNLFFHITLVNLTVVVCLLWVEVRYHLNFFVSCGLLLSLLISTNNPKGMLASVSVLLVSYFFACLPFHLASEQIDRQNYSFDLAWDAFGILMLVFLYFLWVVKIWEFRRVNKAKACQLETLEERIAFFESTLMKDELTGVFNRRKLKEILEREKSLSVRGDYQFSICYIDLDNFKYINDHYGHNAGDKALKKFAQLVQESVRVSDYFFRLAGDEFIVLLSGSAQDAAHRFAQRLCGEYRRNSREIAPFKDKELTISIGVAEYGLHESPESLLKRADAAMYQAKAKGGDCAEKHKV